MRNAFDSRSLWEAGGLKGEAFRGYMELKNKLIPIKLAASLFHPMHVLHIDAAAELTRATTPMLIDPSIGKVKSFMLSMVTSAPLHARRPLQVLYGTTQKQAIRCSGYSKANEISLHLATPKKPPIRI